MLTSLTNYMVSIVMGAPGNYQDRLVQELSDVMSKKNGDWKWVLLKQLFDYKQKSSTIHKWKTAPAAGLMCMVHVCFT